jgi:hypothetical protein
MTSCSYYRNHPVAVREGYHSDYKQPPCQHAETKGHSDFRTLQHPQRIAVSIRASQKALSRYFFSVTVVFDWLTSGTSHEEASGDGPKGTLRIRSVSGFSFNTILKGPEIRTLAVDDGSSGGR